MLGHKFVMCLLHICCVFVMVPKGFVVAFGYKIVWKGFQRPSKAFCAFNASVGGLYKLC